MKEHKYILEPYNGIKTRYRCPVCQDVEKTFTLYIDTETGEYINESVGRCNRENKCGYHYTPKQYFLFSDFSNEGWKPKANSNPRKSVPTKKNVSFIPVDTFKASLRDYEANNFTKYLVELFGNEIASGLISKYFIGTSKHWNGATVFWQIDSIGRIRTGKIMPYNPTTGKRIKEPFSHIAWVHKALKEPQYSLKQCLFGEHLLTDRTKPVAIVESEKTAIIASVYIPYFIWVAVGSLTNLNVERISILSGRTVVLYPDLKGFKKWNDKAKELSHIANFYISDLLERKATEKDKEQGLDIADYLVNYKFNDIL